MFMSEHDNIILICTFNCSSLIPVSCNGNHIQTFYQHWWLIFMAANIQKLKACTHGNPKPTLICTHTHRPKLTLMYIYADLKSNLCWHTESQSSILIYVLIQTQSLTVLHTHIDSKLNLNLQKHRPNMYPWFIHAQIHTLLCSLCSLCMLAMVT